MSQTLSNGSTRSSKLQQFAALPKQERDSLLSRLSLEERAELAYQWDGWIARPNQVEPAGDWLYWLILAGRGFGKTRSGAEWVRKQVKTCRYVNLIAPTAADARDVMVNGESGILAICPPADRPTYYPSKRQLAWPNGAVSTLFSGEDPESLRGPQHERLWCDELAAWQYPQETWDMAMFGLRLGENPRACITTTPKPIRVIKQLVSDPDVVITSGSTYENLENLGRPYQKIISRYEGTRLGRQELYAELLEDEGLAYKFSERVHVVPAFDIPESWERFEHMDYGSSNPTAWYVTAVDYDGNLIVCDGFYEPGLPSEIAPEILRRRKNGWGLANEVYADPSIWNTTGTTNRFGQPASTADEFTTDCGISLIRANNDRRAGYVRISELLRQDERHRFPAWNVNKGQPGSPRMFVMDVPGTRELREQLVDAPLEENIGSPLSGPHPGEAVAAKWEGPHGHGHASLRYGVLSRPSPSAAPGPVAPNIDTHPDEYAVYARRMALIEHEARRERELDGRDQNDFDQRYSW